MQAAFLFPYALAVHVVAAATLRSAVQSAWALGAATAVVAVLMAVKP